MANSNSLPHVFQQFLSPLVRFHHNEDGKLTLVATIMMLGMVVLIGLIGNAGHTVNQKLEVQNAAGYSGLLFLAVDGKRHERTDCHKPSDGVKPPRYVRSTKPWADRGADLKIRQNTNENRALDGIINATKVTAPIGPAPFVLPPLTSIDKKIVDFVVNRTTPRQTSKRGFEAFATIYDSKMTLKRELAKLLISKSLADLGFFVPWPFNMATIPAAYAVHIYATSQIVLIGKEWVILDVVESVAKSFGKLKHDAIAAQLIPTLVAHADFVSSYDAETEDFEAGILNNAVERTLAELQQRMQAELAAFPQADELRLPVIPEPKPNLQSGPTVSGWGSDQPSPVQLPKMDDFLSKLNKAKRDINQRVGDLGDEIGELDGYEQEIDDRLGEDDVSAEEKTELEQEKSEIAESRLKLEIDLAESQSALVKMQEEQAKLSSLDDLPTSSVNPSVARIPQAMNQPQERTTQWIRATQPYTDSFRAPILAMFKTHLKKSKAAEHFEKWSNRYTMVWAWQFRSGYRMEKSGGNSATWRKTEDALHMHVLQDSFVGDRARKGSEPWTTDSNEGKRAAEQYFTLLGFAHREFEPLFSQVVYPSSHDSGLTAFAQAIFYNGNEQLAPAGGQQQAKIGWDTLNWDPDSDVPEWAAPATESNAKWPWEIFNSSQHRVKVKLNWQAKLMPVTVSRLEDAEDELSGEMANNLEHAVEYFDELGTH